MIKTLRLNKASMTVLLAATTLSGCATFKPPEIAYDTPPIEAKLLPEPESPVRIVERTSPLPLPGQLKPINGGDRAPESAGPAERVNEANAAARIETASSTPYNSIPTPRARSIRSTHRRGRSPISPCSPERALLAPDRSRPATRRAGSSATPRAVQGMISASIFWSNRRGLIFRPTSSSIRIGGLIISN